jgi:tetratricopeptide (TPR) repeat protein
MKKNVLFHFIETRLIASLRTAYCCCLLLLFTAGSAATLQAQKKTFERDYTYQASEVDSKVTARTFATEQMRTELLREVGEFLHSEITLARSDTSERFAQKIEAITAGIVEMKILDERWDGATYYIKAEMTVDPKEVNRRIAEVLNDKQKTKELEEARKQRVALEAELQQLKRQLETTKDQALQPAYQAKAYELASKQKGDKAFQSQLYATAVANYQEVAKDNPADAKMYFKLGVALYNQTKYHEAMEQLQTSVRLNPNNADAHLYIALAAYTLKLYEDMFIPLEKCIELQPKNNRCACGLVFAHYAAKNENMALRWCKAATRKHKCGQVDEDCKIHGILREYLSPQQKVHYVIQEWYSNNSQEWCTTIPNCPCFVSYL